MSDAPGWAAIARLPAQSFSELGWWTKWRLRHLQVALRDVMWMPLQGDIVSRKDSYGIILAANDPMESSLRRLRKYRAGWSILEYRVEPLAFSRPPIIVLGAPRSGTSVLFETL